MRERDGPWDDAFSLPIPPSPIPLGTQVDSLCLQAAVGGNLHTCGLFCVPFPPCRPLPRSFPPPLSLFRTRAGARPPAGGGGHGRPGTPPTSCGVEGAGRKHLAWLLFGRGRDEGRGVSGICPSTSCGAATACACVGLWVVPPLAHPHPLPPVALRPGGPSARLRPPVHGVETPSCRVASIVEGRRGGGEPTPAVVAPPPDADFFRDGASAHSLWRRRHRSPLAVPVVDVPPPCGARRPRLGRPACVRSSSHPLAEHGRFPPASGVSWA